MTRIRRPLGFTLLELMIAVAIVSILVGIALPSYRDSVVRGQLVDATTALSAMRARMEQYYQDNRSYAAVTSASTTTSPPCSTALTAGKFTVVCATAPTPSAYTITATGIAGSSVDGFAFSIDQTNAQLTTALPSAWGTAPKSCWITKRGATC